MAPQVLVEGALDCYNAPNMTRYHIVSFFFIALLLFIIANVLLILSPFLEPIFWSAVLAFAFYPMHRRIDGRLKSRPTLSALLSTALIYLTFVPLVIFIVINLSREAVHFYHWIAKAVEDGRASLWLEQLRSSSLVRKIEASRLFHWETLKQNIEDWVLNSAGDIGNFVLKNAAVLTKNVLVAAFNFVISIFLVFFFLKYGKKIYQFFYEITPLEEEPKKAVFHQLSEAFSAGLRGQIVTSVIQAALLGCIFFALGLPLPVFFAATAFIATFIPVFGTASIWVPFVVYLFITAQTVKAIVLLLLGIFVISGADNVIKPYLIGEKTKLPYFLLFLGILGGLKVYGFMGIFLAPAVLSLFFVLVKIYREKFLQN